MATYADLKTRIITETNRDDLADTLASQLTLHIARAIEFYADRRFWFTEGLAASVCVIGNQYVTKPTGLRIMDRVAITIGSVSTPLKVKSLVYIDDLYCVTSIGQPSLYAESGNQIRLYPQPNLAFPLSFIGVIDDTTTLTNDADTNNWTTYGYDLITHRAKFTLYRDQFKDTNAAALANAAEIEELGRLTAESGRRLGTGQVRASW